MGDGRQPSERSVAEAAGPEDLGIVPGKVFETIGLGRPTLLIAPGDSDIEAITAITGGAQRFTGGNIDGISRFIAEAMCGLVPVLREPEMYAWTNISKRFDCLLRTVAGRSAILQPG